MTFEVSSRRQGHLLSADGHLSAVHLEEDGAIRRAGRRTAKAFAWPEIVARNLLPTIGLDG